MGTERNYVDSREEVEEILKRVRECIYPPDNSATINYVFFHGKNRKKNREFIKEYQLNMTKVENIIYNLVCEDFCYSSFNTNVNHSDNLLYIFAPVVSLYNFDDEKKDVTIYIKFTFQKCEGRELVVISFHENEKDSIKYMFK